MKKLSKNKSKRDDHKVNPIRALFDASYGCVKNRKHMKERQLLKESKPEQWIIKASEFVTDGQANTSFTLDEYDPRRVIN